ncbi:YafY family transcriptional regulator [Ornithinimicrobium faecis]|uniref:YafY family transcriptional regulator n=1 Tax=Ornithinimicrobium faecis TaxID=2934158 RepID=A0ABY4YWE3_9MICO|nr:YafY family protein [Ornithinimicrobium sp. HY1793]USQ81103.1 YafY family transcriptional regulator [Ornithinimicrobium sp. HY1793]
MTTPSGRLLTLLSLLQSRRDWPGMALAERLEVTPRTVRRDVDRLRELGYPVQTTKGPAGGYRLAPGADLPPMLFDDEQAVAVSVALQTATSGISGIEEAALRALATIRQVMPARLRHRVDALQVTALRGGSQQQSVDGEVLLEVGRACRDHQRLRFDYTAKDGAQTRRDTEPHRLVSWGRRWYVVAWDLDRDAWRTFRLDRLTPKIPVGPRFTPRELTDEQVDALLSPFAENRTWPAQGSVILHAPARDVARWLGLDQGTVTALTADSCRVEIGSWSYGSLAAWLLLFEADFEVLGPPELTQAFEQIATRVARGVSTGASSLT